MNKKVKFSSKPLSVKIVYIATLAILVITAIVVAAVSIGSTKENEKLPTPDTSENDGSNASTDGEGENNPTEEPKEEAPTFSSPVVGTVSKEHSTDAPVFSETLGAWRTHKGIDIMTDEACAVYAAADGVVSAIYDDPFHGRTVEITHTAGIKTVYSNLAKEDAAFISVGDKVTSGDRIGTVGYTAILEIAEEPHLHFEMTSDDESVDPLEFISEESKKLDLGMKN